MTTMRKHTVDLLFLGILLCPMQVFGQDYFSEYWTRAAVATPYQAYAIWYEYHSLFPQFSATYYIMGNISYDLIETEHPIRDYDQYSLFLYQSKLCYGDCLHYAEGKTLKAKYYPELSQDGKNVPYETLSAYLKERIEIIKHKQLTSKELYRSYTELVERYSLCRQLFTDFNEKYKRAKTAHLLMSEEDVASLQNLIRQADTVGQDIIVFQEALKQHPIPGYNPTFSSVQIALYRLDGLTNSDFLANDIALWDYGAWARDFLLTHETVYNRYYIDIADEYRKMSQTIDIPMLYNSQPDNVLLNRIDRLDYDSWFRPWLQIHQLAAAARQDFYNPQMTQATYSDKEEWLSNALQIVWNQKERQHIANQDFELYKPRIATQSVDKYSRVLTPLNLNAVDSLNNAASMDTAIINRSAHSSCLQFIEQLDLQPFTSALDPISDKVWEVKNLQFTPMNTVVQIIPTGDYVLVITVSGVVYLCDKDGAPIRSRAYPISSDILTAYLFYGDKLALITASDIFFVSTEIN